MDEIIRQILEAAKGEHPEAMLQGLLDRERRQAADAAKGVEDVTAGLKTALAKVKEERDALRPYAQLGPIEELQKRIAEADKLRRQAESHELGVDDAKVQELAEKRAQAMSQSAVQTERDEKDRLARELEKHKADLDHVVKRLETAYVDLDLQTNGGSQVKSLFYPLLRDNARKYYRIEQNGEEPWWKGPVDEPPRFSVVDPKDGKTRLTGKEGPMTTAELVAAKRLSEWADFWPRTDTGPGGNSFPVGDGGKSAKRLDAVSTPGIELLENALPNLSPPTN